MKDPSKVMDINGIRGFQPDPTLTSEEAIVLRALVGGKTNKQVRGALHMALLSFLKMMLDLRKKTGTTSNVSLLVWAQRNLKGGDQRVDRQGRDYAR
ncbi:MAG: helix-turn-helix transcriptional regulator [Candidatus Acidiferrales bacterium]